MRFFFNQIGVIITNCVVIITPKDQFCLFWAYSTLAASFLSRELPHWYGTLVPFAACVQIEVKERFHFLAGIPHHLASGFIEGLPTLSLVNSSTFFWDKLIIQSQSLRSSYSPVRCCIVLRTGRLVKAHA